MFVCLAIIQRTHRLTISTMSTHFIRPLMTGTPVIEVSQANTLHDIMRCLCLYVNTWGVTFRRLYLISKHDCVGSRVFSTFVKSKPKTCLFIERAKSPILIYSQIISHQKTISESYPKGILPQDIEGIFSITNTCVSYSYFSLSMNHLSFSRNK